MAIETIKHTRIPHSKFIYKTISWALGNPFRRLTMNSDKVLTKMGVLEGQTILEIGCGPGFFTIPAAQKSVKGKVYALDIYPMMIEVVERKVRKHQLSNVKTLNVPASKTGLDDESMDLILCIDVLSDITDIKNTLLELSRILKPEGILSIFEPHTSWEIGTWKPEKSIQELTSSGMFSLYKRDGNILQFVKLPNKSS
jgi:demethylmenaquinone methyltransferase/2-methoxy-6-polyprenyl-1,4-benzoquinol methylase